MHQVTPGPASQSYGLQVAKLAGVPGRVLRGAKQKLRTLESGAIGHSPHQSDLFAAPVPADEPEWIESLRQLDPDGLSPREAHSYLYRLIEQAKS